MDLSSGKEHMECWLQLAAELPPSQPHRCTPCAQPLVFYFFADPDVLKGLFLLVPDSRQGY